MAKLLFCLSQLYLRRLEFLKSCLILFKWSLPNFTNRVAANKAGGNMVATVTRTSDSAQTSTTMDTKPTNKEIPVVGKELMVTGPVIMALIDINNFFRISHGYFANFTTQQPGCCSSWTGSVPTGHLDRRLQPRLL